MVAGRAIAPFLLGVAHADGDHMRVVIQLGVFRDHIRGILPCTRLIAQVGLGLSDPLFPSGPGGIIARHGLL